MTLIKKRKYVRKNIKLNGGTGNSNRYINAEAFIPETLDDLNINDKKRLLNEKYNPRLEDARKFKQEIEDNFNREQQILENKRLSDNKLKSLQEIANAKLSKSIWQYRSDRFSAFIMYILHAFKNLFISIYIILLAIFQYVILPIIYGIFRILNKIFEIFLKFLEYFGFTLSEFLVYVSSAFVYILNSIAGFFKNFKSTLFERGPFAHFFVTCIFIAVIFGLVGAMSLASDNYNNKEERRDLVDANNDANVVDTSSGGSSSSDPVAETSQKYLESEEWPSISFSDFMKDPFKTLNKFFSNLPLIIINSIFPPHIRNNVNSNIGMLYNFILESSGAQKIEDSKKILRTSTEQGRPDNIYNVDVNYFNANKKTNLTDIKDIPVSDASNNNLRNVYSIGKPKDIIWKFPENYYKSNNYDYSKLPNSIINRDECSSSEQTYNNKKTLIIPWVLDETTKSFYTIKCDNIKYHSGITGANANENENAFANILTDKTTPGTINTCTIKLNEPTIHNNTCVTIT